MTPLAPPAPPSPSQAHESRLSGSLLRHLLLHRRHRHQHRHRLLRPCLVDARLCTGCSATSLSSPSSSSTTSRSSSLYLRAYRGWRRTPPSQEGRRWGYRGHQGPTRRNAGGKTDTPSSSQGEEEGGGRGGEGLAILPARAPAHQTPPCTKPLHYLSPVEEPPYLRVFSWAPPPASTFTPTPHPSLVRLGLFWALHPTPFPFPPLT